MHLVVFARMVLIATIRGFVKWVTEDPVFLRVIISSIMTVFLTLLYMKNPNGFHIDGQYQLLGSAVLAGSEQVLGRDYSLYLGILPSKFLSLFTELPASLFVLFTGILSLGAWIWAVHLLSSVITRGKPSFPFVALTFLGFFLTMVHFHPELRIFFPDNSALAYRFVFSLGLFFLVDILLQKEKPNFTGIGFLIACMPLISFDFGIPLGLAAGLNVALANSHRLRSVVYTGFVALAFFLGLLLIFTQGHIYEFWQRQAEVADGQYWYFRSYGYKLYTLTEAGNRIIDLTQKYPGYFLTLMAGLVFAWRRSALLAALALLLAPLLLESVGHISDRYYRPVFSFGIFLTIIAGSARIFSSQLISDLPHKIFVSHLTFKPIVYLTAYISLFTLAFSQWHSIKYEVQSRKPLADYARFVSAELSAFFDGLPPGYRLVSEYYNPIAHIYDESIHTSSALAIHALGEKHQQEWINLLRSQKNIYAISTNPTFKNWQSWSVLQQAWYYNELVLNFDPVIQDKQYIIWQHRSKPRKWVTLTDRCELLETDAPAAKKIALNLPADDRVYRVSVVPQHSSGFSLWRAIMRNKTRAEKKAEDFGAPKHADGFFTLLDGGTDSLELIAVRSLGGRTAIEECKVEYIDNFNSAAVFVQPIRPEQFSELNTGQSNHPLDFTDKNWQNGVLTIYKEAAILLSSADPITPLLEEGQILEFSNEEKRRIEKVTRRTKYTEVWLSGSPLNAETHGSPNQFKLYSLKTSSAVQ